MLSSGAVIFQFAFWSENSVKNYQFKNSITFSGHVKTLKQGYRIKFPGYFTKISQY
jgi:hypothetical protein